MGLNSEKNVELTILLDKNIVVKRKFTILRYVQDSLHTFDWCDKGNLSKNNTRPAFNSVMEWVVEAIKNDLSYKSSVWHMPVKEGINGFQLDEDLLGIDELEPKAPWTNVLEVRLTDLDENKLVYSRIVDASQYHPAVLSRIDLTNKMVKVVKRDGTVVYRDKESVFGENSKVYMTNELYMQKLMIWGRQDVISVCIGKIIANCSFSQAQSEKLSRVPRANTEVCVSDGKHEYNYNTSLKQHFIKASRDVRKGNNENE